MQVLRYLGRYTHRVAISNHRLLSLEQERVTFRWKDYARGGQQGKMTLTATEFLRRFFLHVLPKGFVRIRHFGFLGNRFRSSRLALCRQLLASHFSPSAETQTANIACDSISLWHCPRCGTAMIGDSEIERSRVIPMSLLRFFVVLTSNVPCRRVSTRPPICVFARQKASATTVHAAYGACWSAPQ